MNPVARRLLLIACFFIAKVSAVAQSAPALTSMSVTRIISPTGGTEFISPDRLSSERGHAGSTMTFWVTENGYGNNPVATFNGVTLTAGSVSAIVGSNNIVTGFNREFIYSGAYVSGGVFAYQNTSMNYPWNTMRASINVLQYFEPPAFTGKPASFLSSQYFTLAEASPVTSQFTAVDPNGLPVTYSLKTVAGEDAPSNMSISSTGQFDWNGKPSSAFLRSTSCPYPYFAQVYVIAKNSSGSTVKWLLTLQVLAGPMPPCEPPPNPYE